MTRWRRVGATRDYLVVTSLLCLMPGLLTADSLAAVLDRDWEPVIADPFDWYQYWLSVPLTLWWGAVLAALLRWRSIGVYVSREQLWISVPRRSRMIALRDIAKVRAEATSWRPLGAARSTIWLRLDNGERVETPLCSESLFHAAGKPGDNPLWYSLAIHPIDRKAQQRAIAEILRGATAAVKTPDPR